MHAYNINSTFDVISNSSMHVGLHELCFDADK